MKHIKLFEAWGEDNKGMPEWKGGHSKNFTPIDNPTTDPSGVLDDSPDLLLKNEKVSWQLNIPQYCDLDEVEGYLKSLGEGWRLPTIDEYKYIDELLQEEGEEWAYDYLFATRKDDFYWSSEEAFDKEDEGYEDNESCYAWNFNKHAYKICNPNDYTSAGHIIAIKEI